MTLIQKAPKKIYLWNNELKAVYLWETKVRPSVMPAWIYHNAALWLISLSNDWENWITIADKNLGATQVYNNWDTLSEANCGKYYQRWNNYWFPNSWTVTTSSTKVNAGSYWPNNYYNNSTFRTWSYWDTSYNANLWGDTTNTNAARKWPCDTWYHIPSQSEALALINLWITLWAWTSSWGDNMKNILFMPYWWTRSTSWSAADQWRYWEYWTSTKYSNNDWYGLEFYSIYWGVIHIWNAAKTYWMNIRPFKNEAVQPDISRTKLN